MELNETKEKLFEISKHKYGKLEGYTVKKHDFLIGVITYYKKWQKHVFYPFSLHGFTTAELKEVIGFLNGVDGTNTKITSTSKYIEFKEWFETDPKGKWYSILSKKSKDRYGHQIPDGDRELGNLVPNDNGYRFRSEAEDAVYDAQCLEDISNFLSKLGNETTKKVTSRAE